MSSWMNKNIFTIGHSNHSIKDFLHILKIYNVGLLVDIRHYPGSRHCPQFGKEKLKHSLEKAGIAYAHIVGLGGRRKMDKHSPLNAGWRSPQFRGYADYMQTKEFKKNLKELISLSRKQDVALMCAEALPWRCHRSLVGDALLMNDFTVWDIFTESNVRLHELTSFAVVDEKKITYPK